MSESISARYDNQGVSRWDVHVYGLWHCCHCDGLAYLGYQDRLTAEQISMLYAERNRTLQEAGVARVVGFQQFLHYRCGVYLGYGRQMHEEDLETLSRLQELSPAILTEIHSHYLLTHDEAEQQLFDQGLRGAALREAVTVPPVPAEDDIADDTQTAQDYRQWWNALAARGFSYDETRNRFQRFTIGDIKSIAARLLITAED